MSKLGSGHSAGRREGLLLQALLLRAIELVDGTSEHHQRENVRLIEFGNAAEIQRLRAGSTLSLISLNNSDVV